MVRPAGLFRFHMPNRNPYQDGTVKQGARLHYLPAPALKVRFQIAGHGSQVICSVDEECRHMTRGRESIIVDRKYLVYEPE